MSGGSGQNRSAKREMALGGKQQSYCEIVVQPTESLWSPW